MNETQWLYIVRKKSKRTNGTNSTVEARDDCTVVFEQLAIGTRILCWAGAIVGAILVRVKAGATIFAWLVVGAVVIEIFIAKETSPTFIAVTLIRLLAGSVLTAWIADALVTQYALPSQFTSVINRIY